jgi:hypothetical protein
LSNNKTSSEARVSRILSQEFVRSRILPLVSDPSGTATNTEVTASLIRDIGTGRFTVEYRIGGRPRVFAKLYQDDAGNRSYRVLRGLWNAGFDDGGTYQIPKPLDYSETDRVLIMGGVEGSEMTSLIGGEESLLVEGVRRAARWLARLHCSVVREGREGDFSAELLKLSNRLIKAVGQHPQESRGLLEMTRDLRRLAKHLPERRQVVQIHGRFRYDHVLLGRDSVGVIDWDRSCPSDPALDLAEFLHLMRSITFKVTGDVNRAEKPTRAFLEEYSALAPQGAANLSFYWGYYVLVSLSRNIKNHQDHDAETKAKVLFHRTDFEDVMKGRYLP